MSAAYYLGYMVIPLAIIAIIVKVIIEASKPKYPGIKDMDSWANDYVKHGKEYTDKKHLNGDYNK